MTASPQPAPEAIGQSSTPKVAYILGAGRSGSTILGVALGNCAGFVYAGELDKWLLRSGEPPLSGEAQARFWAPVREQVGAVSALGGTAARCLERSSALFRVREWPRRRRLRPEYRRVAAALYRAVATRAKVERIVDSSHYPLRARELQRVEGIELYLIFLVRDPHGVVASFMRRDVPEPTFGVLKTNAYLWLTHALATWVFVRHPRERRLLVQYEDFTLEPEATVNAVARLMGASLAPPDFTSLKIGVPFQGNRLLRSGETIAFRPDPASRAPRSALTITLQLPWRFVFWLLSRERLRPRPARQGEAV